MNLVDLEAASSKKKTAAELKLEQRVSKGSAEQMDAVKKVLETQIVDRYYYPDKMKFVASGAVVELLYQEEGDKKYAINPHAMGQMAERTGLPRKLVSDLRECKFGKDSSWQAALLAHNFNEMFHNREYKTAKGKDIKFLRRAVGNEVRGFQGSNYNRALATAPLLRVFIEKCGVYNARPVEAVTTSVKTILKCMLPYVFEPVDGEFIAIGVTFTNSDFGAARTGISSTIMRISSGSVSVAEDAFRRVHLGKAVEADDGEDLTISDETLKKELAAHESAIRDVIDGQLSYESVEKTLKAIEAAHSHGIEWYKLKNALTSVLAKKDIEFVENLLDFSKRGDDEMDLPPLTTDKHGEPQASAWWAANVVGWLASKEENEDKKQLMQQLAGSFVAK